VVQARTKLQQDTSLPTTSKILEASIRPISQSSPVVRTKDDASSGTSRDGGEKTTPVELYETFKVERVEPQQIMGEVHNSSDSNKED